MTIEKYDLVLCGAGPANTSLLPDIIRIGNIRCLILEKSNILGSGAFKDYKITANSLGGVFLEKFNECNHDLSIYMRKTDAWKELSDNRDKAVNLSLVGKYLEDIYGYIKKNESIDDRISISTNSEVKKIIKKENGEFDITYQKNDETFTISSKKVAFNIGGKSKERHNSLGKIKVNSDDVIKGVYDKNIKDKSIKNISIVGSSHSAVSCLIRIIEQLNFKGPIKILTNKKFRFYYSSPSDAEKDNYLFQKDDICSLSQRVNRYSGLRYDSHIFAKKIYDGIYENIEIFNTKEASDDSVFNILNNSDLVINCTGYESKLINMKDQNDKEIELCMDRFGVVTNSNLNPILKSGDTLQNFYTFGLGSGIKTGGECGGEKSFEGKIDGVWVYQHVVPKLIFEELTI